MRFPVAAVRPLVRFAVAFGLTLCVFADPAWAESATAQSERVKGSIVAIGTYERTRTPPFQFRGTGFAIGDGSFIATNAHVLPGALDATRLELLGILVPAEADGKVQFREAKQSAVDPGSDLAILAIGGA